MACSECMFCQCRSSHVTISEGTTMLLQPVLQGPPSLPNVHFWAFRAGNEVDYSLLLIHWHSVLGVNQELAKGHQRAKHHLDVQWCEDSSDSF